MARRSPNPTIRVLVLGGASLLLLGSSAAAQLPDARLIPRGALRVGFIPQYQSWDHRFAEDGTEEPLGKDLSADSAGANLFPTVTSAQAAVRAITGDSTYRMSLGSMRTTVDADVRRFPFEFSLGVTRWLTISATVPWVITRVNTALAVDSSSGNAGFNQAGLLGPYQIATLLAQLATGAAALDAMIAAGTTQCGQPQMVSAQTKALRLNLIALSGVLTGSSALPPLAPLASSQAGQNIVNAIAADSDSLVACGVAPLTANLPLPGQREQN